MSVNAEAIRPIGKWVVVHSDPRVKQTKGGIILTEALTGVERVMEGTGRVLSVGGQVHKVVGTEITPGMRVCYRGFVKDASSMVFEKIDGRDVFMLHAKDILMIIEDDVRMGEFS